MIGSGRHRGRGRSSPGRLWSWVCFGRQQGCRPIQRSANLPTFGV